MSSSSIVFREAPISGHVFRRKRKSGDRWMAKWRDGEGQHQAVLGKAWTKRGRPAEGYLTKQGAQRELDAILADARRYRITSQSRLASTVTFAEAAREWLRYVEHDRKRRPSTIADYRWIVERRLLPDFGELALESITTQRIDSWRVELVAAGGIADGEGLGADDQQVPRGDAQHPQASAADLRPRGERRRLGRAPAGDTLRRLRRALGGRG